MNNLTVFELEKKLGLSEKSLKRKLDRWYNQGKIKERYGLHDELPDDVSQMLIEGKRPAGKTAQVARKRLPKKRMNGSVNQSSERAEEKPSVFSNTIFSNQAVALVAATLFIAADGMSCAWIAFQAFGDGDLVAVQMLSAIFFFAAGMAIGYVAIRFIISYDGYNMSQWSFGFGAFQFLVHCSALGVLEPVLGSDMNLLIGEFVIVLGIVISTAAVAMTFRTKKIK